MELNKSYTVITLTSKLLQEEASFFCGNAKIIEQKQRIHEGDDSLQFERGDGIVKTGGE